MGADIWLGKPGDGLGYFRDSYTGAITLNAIGLSWWQDIAPLLERGGRLPLEKNSDLLALIEQSADVRLYGPNALLYARQYLIEAQLPAAIPERMIEYWKREILALTDLIKRSTEIGVPLSMSL